jgi:hypothetical protein
MRRWGFGLGALGEPPITKPVPVGSARWKRESSLSPPTGAARFDLGEPDDHVA